MSVKVEWNGDEYAKRLEKGVAAGVEDAAFLLQNAIKARLNRLGKFKSFDKQATQADRDFIAGSGWVDPPGGSPRRRTGRLGLAIKIEPTAPNVRTVGVFGDLAYAAIHEFGGQINHPGGTPYIVVKSAGGQMQARFVKKSRVAALVKKGLVVKLTKPHTINMPARPFMRPSFEAMKDRMIEVYRARVARILGGD